MSEVEKTKMTRRKYLKYAGGIVAAAAVSAAGYGIYEATKPTPVVTPRPTSSSTSTSTVTAAPVTLKVSTIVGINGLIATTLKEAFEKAFPNIKLEITQHPWEEVTEIQLTDMAAHTASYDVVTTFNSALAPYAKPGHIYPIDEFIKKYKGTEFDLADQLNDLAPKLLEACMYDGKVYGMPQNWWTFVLYYRKDLVQQKGLELPKTFLDIPNFAAGLTGGGRYGWAETGLRGGAGCNTYTWYNYLWSFGGDILDKDYKPIFNSAEGVEALKLYVDLLKYASPEVMSLGCDQNTSLMQQDKIAAGIHDSDQMGFLQDPKASTVVDKFGMHLMPSQAGRTAMLGYWQITINADTPYKDEAYKYIQFMTRPESVRAWVDLGQAPPLMSLLKDPELIAKHPELPFGVLLDTLEDVKSVPKIPEYIEIEDRISVAIADAMMKKKTPKEALDWAASEVEAILKKAGYSG